MKINKKVIIPLAVILVAALAISMFFILKGDKYYNYNLDKYVAVTDYEIGDLPSLKDITDEDVLKKIKSNFSSFCEEEVVTGVEIKDGDYVTISVACVKTEDLTEVEVLKYESLVVNVGSLYVTEGFSEKFLGYKSGDKVQFEMVLDESLAKFELNGVKVRFDCVINEHVSVTYPEFTDEFIKENSDFNTYDEYYSDVKKKLEESNKVDNESEKIDRIWSTIEESTEIKQIPEKELAIYEEAIRSAHAKYASDLKLDFVDYLENHMNMDENEFEEFVAKNAKDSVENDLIIKSTAKKYGVTLSEDEYKTYLETQREAFGFETAENFEEYYGELTLRQLALETKVSEYLLTKYN